MPAAKEEKPEEVSAEVAARRAMGKTDYPSDEPDEPEEAEVDYDVPAAGQSTDAKQRMAKLLVASGVDLPEGLSVTHPDRTGVSGGPADDTEPAAKTAAEKRAAAGESRLQGRTAVPPGRAKAAEDK